MQQGTWQLQVGVFHHALTSLAHRQPSRPTDTLVHCPPPLSPAATPDWTPPPSPLPPPPPLQPPPLLTLQFVFPSPLLHQPPPPPSSVAAIALALNPQTLQPGLGPAGLPPHHQIQDPARVPNQTLIPGQCQAVAATGCCRLALALPSPPLLQLLRVLRLLQRQHARPRQATCAGPHPHPRPLTAHVPPPPPLHLDRTPLPPRPAPALPSAVFAAGAHCCSLPPPALVPLQPPLPHVPAVVPLYRGGGLTRSGRGGGRSCTRRC